MNMHDKLNKLDKYVNRIHDTIKFIYNVNNVKNIGDVLTFNKLGQVLQYKKPSWVRVNNMKTGGVNFYDYDGTVLYTYDKDEFLSLTEMPTLPTQPGLICQGWNWDLEDAQEYVSKYSTLNIGATYITDDGKTRFYIELLSDDTVINLEFYQTVSGDNFTTIDWGDGTNETMNRTGKVSITHIYPSNGKYTITLSTGDGCILNLYSDNSNSNPIISSTYLKKVEIGESVTSIGSSAFYRCYYLQSVTIPDSVTTIGYAAFYYCYSLQSITIPNSVTTIGASAFSHCISLRSIAMPDGITSIEDYVFSNCIPLQSITIPDSVTSIGEGAFYECHSLHNVVIGNSVTTIGESAFSYCDLILNITIPDSVTTIGESAFQYCSSSQNIVIGNSVTSIRDYAFGYCSSFQDITIPNSVTSIGKYAFQYCTSLRCMDFTSHTSIPTLGTDAFYRYPSGFKILVPAALYDNWCNATNWSTYKSKMVAVQPTFRISHNGEIVYTSQFKNGMTWNDYIESDYNTGTFNADPESVDGILFAFNGNAGPSGSGYILNDADGYPISDTDLIVNGSTYHTGSAGGPI